MSHDTQPYAPPLPFLHCTRALLQNAVLSERLIGQSDAVDSVSSALCRARCGLQDPRRPLASLLFVGPTGEAGAGAGVGGHGWLSRRHGQRSSPRLRAVMHWMLLPAPG